MWDTCNYLRLQWRESCFLCVLPLLLPLQLLNPESPFLNALLSLLHYQPISPSPKTQRFPFAPLSALPPSHSRHTKLPFWTNPTTTVLLPLCPKSTRPAASAAPAPPENSLCKFFFFLSVNVSILVGIQSSNPRTLLPLTLKLPSTITNITLYYNSYLHCKYKSLRSPLHSNINLLDLLLWFVTRVLCAGR